MKRRRTAPRVKLNRTVVRALLDELAISQTNWRGCVDFPPGYLSQLISGVKSPSPRVLRKFQQVLGVSDFDRLIIIEWPSGDVSQTTRSER